MANLLMAEMQQAADASETVADIVNTAATAEAMAVTLLGAAIGGAAGYDGGKGLDGGLVRVLKAAQASEQAHYAFLTGAGAKPLTTTFNLPDQKIATDSATLFATIEALETAFISAYGAAAREFAAMGNSALTRVALQIGAVEAEHRALARFAQGAALPHNLAFESMQFNTVGEAAKALQSLGFIGGSGPALSYADFAGKVDFTGVSELAPSGPGEAAAPASGASFSGHLRQGGTKALYTFDYPGDESVYTVNMQVTPDDAAVLKNAGFKVYAPSGSLVIAGGAQRGLMPNVSGNVISRVPGTYTIEAYDFDPAVPIDYTISLTMGPRENQRR